MTFLFLLLSTFVASAEVKTLVTYPAKAQKFQEISLFCDTQTQGGSCSCFEPLNCEDGKCMTLDSGLKRIRELAKGKVKGQALDCAYAEYGSCGDLKYIYCDTQVFYTLRFFDSKGSLVATKKFSDDTEFCDSKARFLYQGFIPSCSSMKKLENLYGKGRPPSAP